MNVKRLGSLSMWLATSVALILAIPEVGHTQVQDIVPPQLVELSISPLSIDVTSGPQDVAFAIRATDALSGFNSGSFAIFSPSAGQAKFGSFGAFNRISGDEFDGVYQTVVTFPQFSEAGTWHISGVNLFDVVGNSRFLNESDLINAGFSTTLEVTGGPDLAAPSLLSLNINPSSIDVNSGPQDVAFTIRVSDALSGFNSGSFAIFSPSTGQAKFGSFGAFNRISGDQMDGVYQTVVTFPRFSEAGTWHISGVNLFDVVGNSRFLTETDLINAGFSIHLEVASNPDDTVPPILVELSISPSSIDVSSGPQDVAFTIRATDALSGFNSGSFAIFSPSAGQAKFGSFGAFNRISGDEMDGVYQTVVTFPQFSEAGTWHISGVNLFDVVGNSRFLNESDLINAGFSTTLETTQAPQLTALGTANVWLGLKNSDDVGTKFDLLAEVLKNGSPVGSGQLNGVAGGSSGFNNAVQRSISLALSSPVSVGTGDVLSIKLSVRIAVGVSGHRSGTARLWFNDSAANSRFGATIGGVTQEYFMLDSFTLGAAAGPGPKKTIDVFVDRAVGGNPFKPFGTWTKTF